jgi:serine/threonine protein phosphatase PrpC
MSHAGAIAPAAVAGVGPLVRDSAATHPGTVRQRNEDSVLVRPDIALWAVADGAGGHGAGDVASQAVVAALAAIPPGLPVAETLLQARLRLGAAHAALLRQAAEAGPGRIIATTLVLVAMGPEGGFTCLWAGDSRAYRLSGDGRLHRLTRDHSLVQQLVDEGRLTEAEAEAHPKANVILRAVGAGEEPLELDAVDGRCAPGETLLLCSDGLFKALPEAELADRLGAGEAAEALVAAAVARGARDNVSAITLRHAAAAEPG